jgi:hypothetical protein
VGRCEVEVGSAGEGGEEAERVLVSGGFGVRRDSVVKELRSMGRASEEKELTVAWRSSMAIWWVSRSESLAREVRIFYLSSTIARREDTYEDLEDWAESFAGFEEDFGF